VSLAVQQALMKEVDHRVKNNLEVVNSLLMLQSDFLADPKLRSVLVETANRVRVIADIHRLLYAAPKLDQVDLAAFVEQLADSLFAFYSGAGARVHLDLHAERVTTDLQRAVPIGSSSTSCSATPSSMRFREPVAATSCSASTPKGSSSRTTESACPPPSTQTTVHRWDLSW
jgi:hypothetical protein